MFNLFIWHSIDKCPEEGDRKVKAWRPWTVAWGFGYCCACTWGLSSLCRPRLLWAWPQADPGAARYVTKPLGTDRPLGLRGVLELQKILLRDLGHSHPPDHVCLKGYLPAGGGRWRRSEHRPYSHPVTDGPRALSVPTHTQLWFCFAEAAGCGYSK